MPTGFHPRALSFPVPPGPVDLLRFLAVLQSPLLHFTSFRYPQSETRLVQVGESAGPTVALPAAVLRSCALTILGTAGIPPRDVLVDAFQQVTSRAASGELRIDIEQVPLDEVENAWQRDQHSRRIVLIPRTISET